MLKRLEGGLWLHQQDKCGIVENKSKEKEYRLPNFDKRFTQLRVLTLMNDVI